MHNPNFSSGPCAKRPGWTFDALQDAALGRSHRSTLGRKKLARAIDETKRILGIPEDYLVGIMPGSDTGAFETALWNLLGPAGDRPRMGKLFRGLGNRCGQATEVIAADHEGPLWGNSTFDSCGLGHRCGFCGEWHDEWSDGAELGLDPRESCWLNPL